MCSIFNAKYMVITLLSKFNADIKPSCSCVDKDTDVILTISIKWFTFQIYRKWDIFMLIDGEYHKCM